jgi:hypothetical protein
MREGLEGLATNNGRSLSQQTEILLEHALWRELAVFGVDYPAPTPAPSTKDLHNRLFELELTVSGLKQVLEKGLQDNASSVLRMWSRLERLTPLFEAKLAADATEITTAITQLQSVTAHLLATLQKVDAALTGRTRDTTEAPRPRLVSGDESA